MLTLLATLVVLLKPKRRGAQFNLGTMFLVVTIVGLACNEAEPADPKLERFQLDNGLTVLVRPISRSGLAAIMVVYGIGGDHDPKGRCGLAHMIEHLYVTAAAGSEKARTADEFMQRYPSGWEAHTGDRFTVIRAVFPVKDLDNELQDAAARMGDLRIAADDLQREKPRIEEELNNMFERIPSLAALNRARELLRPTPQDGRRGGVIEQVTAITREEAHDRWERFYKPTNATLIVVGGVDGSAVRKTIRAQFGKLPSGEACPAAQEPGRPRQEAIQETVVEPLDPRAGDEICLAYAAPSPGSDLYAAYLVFAARLSRKAQQSKGTDRFEVYCVPLIDSAVLCISMPVNKPETAQQAVERAEAIVAELVKPQITKDDLAHAKDEFGFLLGILDIPESPFLNMNGLALRIGGCQQMGIDGDKLRTSLETISDDELRRAAREIFASERHSAALVSVKR